ncbi:hypothetical protein [uncultured Psychrobacter sp.]|uniref:hypothetical protein n=1 Tax=uncultured Psychrobacter sp. TaxID=259303 RepID=UPI003459FED6
MGQYFNLQLATNTLTLDAQQLDVDPQQLEQICIKVHAKLIQHPKPQLWLTFYIQLPNATLAAQLNWPAWQQQQVVFTDYLWEQTCLECFISGPTVKNNHTSQTAYIEINASPSGSYALYQFNDYRKPSCLPPMPLIQANTKEQAYINWADDLITPLILSTAQLRSYPTLSADSIARLALMTFVPCYLYKRSFGIPLDQLPPNLFIKNNRPFNSTDIIMLHPCAVLRFNDTLLYFAPNHAIPPDFHQRQYWTHFDRNKVTHY